MTAMRMILSAAGVLLAILTVLVIYRSTLEMHEDDQLFLSSGETQMAKEQEELQAKLGKLEPLVKILGALCVVLILTAAGMWVYGGLSQTSNLAPK